MQEIREAIELIKNSGSDTVHKSELVPLLDAIELELSALRVVCGMVATKARVDGTDVKETFDGWGRNFPGSVVGIKPEVQSKAYDILHHIDQRPPQEV